MKQKLITTKITRFGKKGSGLGEFERQDGEMCAVEVPFAIPGDEVQALVLKKRRGLYQARLEEVLSPSEMRVEPRCRHFGVCGGCRLQQMPYEKQLENKAQVVAELFPGEQAIHPILACDPPWHYRNKMEFTFSMDRDQNAYLGLIMVGGKGRVFELQECHLANPWFAEMVEAVRLWWKDSGLLAYNGYRDSGSLRYLTLREGKRTGDKMITLTVSGNPDFALKRSQIESFQEAVKSVAGEGNVAVFLRIQQIAKGRPTQFYEMHLAGPDSIREVLHVPDPLTFQISPAAFFQPNTQQAEKLYQRALALAEIQAEDVVYDLYCGTGTLGMIASLKAKKVVGVELSPEAVLDARENAKRNGIESYEVLQGDVGEVLKRIWAEGRVPPPDVVMVDPPRVGLDSQAVEHILDLFPRKILYISCNPVTQAENCEQFKRKGYRIADIQPVDQFPHTVHIENIVILIRDLA